MRTRAGYQFLGYVVDGDCVLVLCGILVALVSDVDESEYLTSKANCLACARCCAVSAASRVADCFVLMDFGVVPRKE